MQQVVNRKFWDAFFNTDINILEFFWKKPEDGSELEEEDFKPYLFEVADLLKKYNVSGFIVDARPYHMVMSLGFQEWHDNTIIPLFIENGLKHMVFILNEDALMEVLSIEQTFEEDQAKALQTHFKDSLESARSVFL